MCLGALVSAGVPIDYLNATIACLGLDKKVKIWSELVHRCGQEATKVHVDLLPDLPEAHTSIKAEPERASEHHEEPHDHAHTHRHLPEIEKMIQNAGLPMKVELWSLRIFRRLAIAEGKVHGIPTEQVHFHEVGALDAISDIVCTCAGLDWLDVDQLFCSAMPTGGGFVHCEHGLMPVPAPAVLKLWELHEVPVFSNGIDKELVTPTGAAIAVSLCDAFGKMPNLRIKKVGIGAGTQDLTIPNTLRLWIGEGENSPPADLVGMKLFHKKDRAKDEDKKNKDKKQKDGKHKDKQDEDKQGKKKSSK